MKDQHPSHTNDDNEGKRYRPADIEARIQQTWNDEDLYRTPLTEANDKCFYALSMFPYPSGTLHMGHVRNYVITDVIARQKRMLGYKILHPMGWDSFGLPAENAAIDRSVSPKEWTVRNIAHMKSQLDKLGLSIDWNKEQSTSKSDYYKWTQYIFLELYQAGLAYQKQAIVNWDPIDKTVLANEQVDSEGNSWRSGAKVQKKSLKQWFLKITDYAQKLDDDLSELEEWPSKVKTMQANWIGRSEGAEIDFQVDIKENIKITVYTTRIDTLTGVTYLALSPDNDLIDKIAPKNSKQIISEFREKVASLSTQERIDETRTKSGIPIGVDVINPLTNTKIPIWIADYVLSDYGSGAVMGVPAHDTRDYLFAETYQLTKLYVIRKSNELVLNDGDGAYTEDGFIFNSGIYDGMSNSLASQTFLELAITNNWGRRKVNFRLRDWLISRQRYWGCPIPIIHCLDCGVVPVPYTQLPVSLPDTNAPLVKGNSLKNIDPDWLITNCPKCGSEAKRETDTMDTFMCSSWYFLRFADSSNEKLPFDKKCIDKWLPVNQYVGGIEHAILHLLYSRFLTKVLFDRGLVSIKEPFVNLLTQGMVQGKTYKNKTTGTYIPSKEIKDLNNPTDPNSNEELQIIYEKMSKSKFNGIDPSTVINKYGADTARMFILFKAPPEKDLEWNDSDVEGQYRFLLRIWNTYVGLTKNLSSNYSIDKYTLLPKSNISSFSKEDKQLYRAINLCVKNINQDLTKNPQFNTAISELMKLHNILNELLGKTSTNLSVYSFSVFLRLLAPFAPHLSDELWRSLGGQNSIHVQDWPTYDEEALKADNYELVIQIKGKVRGRMEINIETSKQDIEKLVLNSDTAIKWLDGKKPSRIILVPGKLINLVP